MASESLYLKARSAAALADISTRKLYYWVSEGKLPKPVDLGGVKRWRRSELIGALDRLADGDAGGRRQP